MFSWEGEKMLLLAGVPSTQKLFSTKWRYVYTSLMMHYTVLRGNPLQEVCLP